MIPLRMLPVALLVTIAAIVPSSGGAAPKDDAAAAFAACSGCHLNNASGRSTMGPNLGGVVGRKIGSLPGYRYSPAMANAQGNWTRERLDSFLAAPTKDMPGTRMVVGVPDAKRRALIITFLSRPTRGQ